MSTGVVACVDSVSALARLGVAYVVYVCDLAYEWAYDSVYDLLLKVSRKLIFNFFDEMYIQTIVMGVR
jgi:hypothetical protein